MYQAESCRGPRRGKLSVIVVLHNVVFYCIASWLTLAFSYINTSAQWRVPLALQVSRTQFSRCAITNPRLIQLVPCIVMCTLLPLLPESPRWLVMKDRRDDAHEALRRYLGEDLPLDDPAVINELLSIEEAYNIERKSRITLKEVILSRDRSGHLKRLLLGCGGQFMQQFGGINALNYYFPIILTENIGLSVFMARVLTGCNATSYMISSGLCFWMIERFGRRSLMLSGLVLQCVAYVMVALAVGLLATAPFQVSHFSPPQSNSRLLTVFSGVPLESRSYSSTMLLSAALGGWCLGYIRPRSTHWLCGPLDPLRQLQQIGCSVSFVHSSRPQAFGTSDIDFTSVCLT
jgi:MFS family permease